jgi:quercetin dioxygenase-like cupin family protein
MFKSDTFRLVLVALHEGASLNPHTARGVISVQVLEGKIKFSTDKETVELEKGQLLVLHESISHSVEAKKESTFLLTLAINEELKSDSAH